MVEQWKFVEQKDCLLQHFIRYYFILWHERYILINKVLNFGENGKTSTILIFSGPRVKEGGGKFERQTLFDTLNPAT